MKGDQLRESRFVMPVIRREQAITVNHCVSADQEISKNSPRRLCSTLFTALHIAKIRSSRFAPNIFAHDPIDSNTRIREKHIQVRFFPEGTGHQLRIDWP